MLQHRELTLPAGGVFGGGAVGGGGAGDDVVDVGGAAGGGIVGGAGAGSDAFCRVAACGADRGDGRGSPRLTFVGYGLGSYTPQTKYKYVGFGAGEFDYILPKPPLPWLVVVFVVVIIAVIIGVIMFLFPGTVATFTQMPTTKMPTTTRMSISTQKPAQTGLSGTCRVWGDPHIETFDHAFPSYYEQGDFWLVHSEEVSIQARYGVTPWSHGLSATHAVAIGGPFLRGNTIVVEPVNGDIKVNGQLALTSFPDSMSIMAGAEVRYDDGGELVDPANLGLDRHIVHMDLPLDIHVDVLRWWYHINVRITMPPLVGGQHGDCGNFDTNPSNDRTNHTISATECLFPQCSSGRPTPLHIIDECAKDVTKYYSALRACGATETDVQDKGSHKYFCVFDVCFAGPQYAAEDESI